MVKMGGKARGSTSPHPSRRHRRCHRCHRHRRCRDVCAPLTLVGAECAMRTRPCQGRGTCSGGPRGPPGAAPRASDAGRRALVWKLMLQPSARPQGVPVGPQSTCHAPDRGASTMSIPYPLGLTLPNSDSQGLTHPPPTPAIERALVLILPVEFHCRYVVRVCSQVLLV